jgi:HEAT repeat protein
MRDGARGGRLAAIVVAVTCSLAGLHGDAGAQSARPWPTPVPHPAPPRPPLPLPATADDVTDLRARFGVERAERLLGSADEDDRLRGLERAASLGTPEAIALLVREADASAATRGDARAKIAIARGLAAHAAEPSARGALMLLVGLATPRAGAQKGEIDEPVYLPRLEVARRIAALALARSGDERAVESLVALARGTTAGANAAAAALAAFPPSGTTPWAKPMSPGVARLVARVGDRRALGELLAAAGGANGADGATRGAAIEALGELGDARVLPIASRALGDDDPRVRVAATSALVTMGAPDAPRAVERLLADDQTAGRAIELARVAHGAGIVHALAARAAVSADHAVRAAAVAALGRDPTADGTEALSAFLRDPILRTDAGDAIARSPSPSAMGAIERLAAEPGSRRIAARAYVVRAIARPLGRETSAALETTIGELARSSDASDRAIGVFARVVLGEASATASLADREPLVRRAAAMASLAGGETSATRAELLARRAVESDVPARVVLAAGLVDGDLAGAVPTRALLTCARAGGADGPMCALAFAARASDREAAEVDGLLGARDPVLRAHAARGLAGSTDSTRGGRLAAAYAYEPDALVRRALVAGLVAIPLEARSSSLAETVAFAARFDPDPETRAVATHPPPLAPDERRDADVVWIHLVDASSTAAAPPAAGTTGALLRSDGLAIPIAFDADGDALVPGVPVGGSRLVLAPRLDAAYAPSP